jgi:hypothetical protein
VFTIWRNVTIRIADYTAFALMLSRMTLDTNTRLVLAKGDLIEETLSKSSHQNGFTCGTLVGITFREREEGKEGRVRNL